MPAPANSSTSAPAAGEATQAVSSLPTASTLPEPTRIILQPAMPERRRLTLEFPPQIRAGDADVVRLTLEVDDLGNVTPTAEIGGHVVTGQTVEVPDLYETHNVVAEARFDLAGMEIRPADLVSQPLTQGTSATFIWSVHPKEVGDYRGTIWLYLRFTDKVSGEESQKTISAQIVEIKVANFLGLSGALARTTGVAGSIVGTLIGLPFLEDIIKFLFKKLGKSAK